VSAASNNHGLYLPGLSGGPAQAGRPAKVRRVLLSALMREVERLKAVEGSSAAAEVIGDLLAGYLATLPPSYVGEPTGGDDEAEAPAPSPSKRGRGGAGA
jgi:hypothetical protein